MAMVKCRECGKEISSEAETCPSCGIEDPGPGKRLRSRIGTAIKAVLGIGVVVVLIGAISEGSLNHCEVLDTSDSAEVFIINGQADAGFKIQALVRNTGSAANMDIVSVLSSSEGDFSRKRKIYLKKDQQRVVDFQFHEPTINATDLRYSVSCR